MSLRSGAGIGPATAGCTVAVHYGGIRLAEVVLGMKGLKYQAAAQAMKRFGERLANDPERRRFVLQMQRQLSTI